MIATKLKENPLRIGMPPEKIHANFPPGNRDKQPLVMTSLPTTATEVEPPLTAKEKDQLAHCEEIIRKGLKTFFEVGNALLTIREQHLYRAYHTNFETYRREKLPGRCHVE